jgi:hypothetical protein
MRKLKITDVRLSRSGYVIAAPEWAFDKWPGRYGYSRISYRVWKPLEDELKKLREERERADEAQRELDREHYGKVSADPDATDLARVFAQHWLRLDALGRTMRRNRRPFRPLHCPSDKRTCPVCGKKFFGHWTTATCTDACAKKRRDATRTRKPRPHVAHELRPCAQCGERFLPHRADALFCSLRCRVAAHRAKK